MKTIWKNTVQVIQLKKEDASIYLLGVLASLILIVLIFFKFLPDIGNGVIQKSPSVLTSWQFYEDTFLKPHSVHHARFLGNIMVHRLAHFVSPFVPNNDIRLHPLRIAATLLTLFWFLVSLLPTHLLRPHLNWKIYLPAFSVMFIAGLYVYYPCDAPALALLTLSLVFILRDQLGWALMGMIVTGLFRESSFHLVASVAFWAWCARHHPLRKRWMWLGIFICVFSFEYKLTRLFYPGVDRGIEFYRQHLINHWEQIFLGKGLLSLTSVMTLFLGLLYPIAWWRLKRSNSPRNWQESFFALNSLAFLFWIFFYRIQGGGFAEFRMMWPIIIPCVLGLAWKKPD